VHLPAAAGGDAPQLLDVDVHEVARMEVLVAADRPSRRPVEPGEPVQAESVEHPVDRGGGESESVGDANGP